MLDRHEVRTPTGSQDELLEGIAAAIEPLAARGMAALGFGIPSVIDRATGQSLGSVNIPLEDVALGRVMGERFGVPATVENDGNAAALAEWRLGAGQGAENMVMLTLGTGVGGGLVLGGALYRGWAELGHVVVVADGPLARATAPGRGHLEALASGQRRGPRRARSSGETARTPSCSSAGPRRVTPKRWRRSPGIGHLLGAAIGSFVNIFAPSSSSSAAASASPRRTPLPRGARSRAARGARLLARRASGSSRRSSGRTRACRRRAARVRGARRA